MGGPPLPSTLLDEEGLPKPPVRDIEEVERPEMEEADPSLPLRDMAAAAELVERFVDITGASSSRACALLSAHGWTLERALRAHTEAEEKIKSIERGRAPRSTAKTPPLIRQAERAVEESRLELWSSSAQSSSQPSCSTSSAM